MISIAAKDVYKRYQRDWIIDKFNYTFDAGSHTGISGRNGSGKSTLLRILSGFLSSSKGSIEYSKSSTAIPEEDWYKHFAYFGPNINLNDELYPSEIFDFVMKNKALDCNNATEFLNIIELDKHKDKPLKSFSSGMKQRLALGLTIMSKAEILFLDEPSSFLDVQAKEWMHSLLGKYTQNKTVIIASNEQDDFISCSKMIAI